MKMFHLKLLASAGVFCPLLAGAAVRSKANNADDLHLASCWFTAAPGAADVASFDFYPTSQSPRSSMTQDLSWGGISVASTSQYGCRFGPSPGTAYYQLTLGASGIVASGGTTSNRGVVINADLLLGASQTWSGVAGTSVNVAGTYRPTGSYFDLGGNTLTISAVSASFTGNNPAPYAVKNGTIILNGASLRIGSGTRPTGVDPDPVCDVPSSLSIHVNAASSLTPWNNALSSENLQWNANVILNGGTLFASGYQGYFAGSADSTNNTVGGTILVNAASSIELSSEISFTFNTEQDTVHRISAAITGNQTLAIKNASKTAARNLIVLSGDNSGFTNAVSLAADASDGVTSGRVRLASDTAGSPGPWSIAAGNTLEIQNASVSLGYLTASGNVVAVGGGASILNLSSAGSSTRTLNGAVLQSAGSVLHLRKAGTYQQVIASPGWNGNTTVDGGKLSLSKSFLADDSEVRIATGAVLKLTHGKVDRVGKLFLVGVGGVGEPDGTWGGIGSGADHETAQIEGSGFLRVGTPSAYEAWIESVDGLSGAAAREPSADPDGDGADNFKEFAFGGDPTSSATSGQIRAETADRLRLIVAMRTGAVFSRSGQELVSAPLDGIIYRIQAATSPGVFPGSQADEISGFTPPTGLPPLPQGWEYRGFETHATVTAEPNQFIRAVAQPAN